MFNKYTFTKPTVSVRLPRLLLAASACYLFLFNKLPQNFVAWNNHFILLMIFRVRNLLAHLGGISLSTLPKKV